VSPKADPHVLLVPQGLSHVERRSHLWCNRCSERMLTPVGVRITTFVEVMRGFERAHGECKDLPVASVLDRPAVITPQDWLHHGEVGLSSKTIWRVMTGHPVAARDQTTPSDPDDFRRCHLLLEAFPAWRARLPEVAARYPAWAPLVREWDRLTALYLEEIPTGYGPRLSKAMQELDGHGPRP